MTTGSHDALTREQIAFNMFLDNLVRSNASLSMPLLESESLETFAVELNSAANRTVNSQPLDDDPLLTKLLAAQQSTNVEPGVQVFPLLPNVPSNQFTEQSSSFAPRIIRLLNWAAIAFLLIGSTLISALLLRENNPDAERYVPSSLASDTTVIEEWVIQPSADLSAAPLGISIAPDGNIWVPVFNAGTIQIYNQDGQLIEEWGETGTGPGQFSFGSGSSDYPLKGADIAWDSQGNIYVTDRWNHRVQKFDSTRTYLLTFEEVNFVAGSTYAPFGIAIGPDDAIYLNDDISQTVYVFDTNGTALERIVGGGTNLGLGPLPGIPVVAADGTLWVSSCRWNTVNVYASDGTELSAFGTNVEFNCPRAVALDSDGHFFVADEGNARVQIYTIEGVFLAEWNLLSDGSTFHPIALEVSDGFLYVLDHEQGRIIKISIRDNLMTP